MSTITIEGGHRLSGSMTVHGSKNAVLPMMAASILYPGVTVLRQVPRILDVFYMIEILERLGCRVEWTADALQIDASAAEPAAIPSELTGKMRSSVFLLGPLLGRCSQAAIGAPGGCSIGSRPVDIHLNGLRKLGAQIREEDCWYFAECKTLTGCEVFFPFPSVGATENLVMAAVAAQGETILHNVAQEPEIVDFCRMLMGMGARIQGIGSSTLRIIGGTGLHESVYTVGGDRIEAATYLIAAAATGGELAVENISADQLGAILTALSISGCEVHGTGRSVYLRRADRLRAVPFIRTAPFPGFPTDVQSQMMALLACGTGRSRIQETIFEGRFQTAEELQKMGADIRVEQNRAEITGCERLHGAAVRARDLRGGAALVIAALAAEGVTEISDCCYIRRGYAELEEQLTALGAVIRRGR